MNIMTLSDRYFFHEEYHGHSLFKACFPNEYRDVYEMLEGFSLTEADIVTPGGRRSSVPDKLDNFLQQRYWGVKQFDVNIQIDGTTRHTPTHEIDNFKNGVGVEVEWNNKDTFFDRDLNNFRLLHSVKALSVGIVITRCDELQSIFNSLNVGRKYGASTTHIGKLMPKINSGGAGACPLFIIGINQKCYYSR